MSIYKDPSKWSLIMIPKWTQRNVANGGKGGGGRGGLNHPPLTSKTEVVEGCQNSTISCCACHIRIMMLLVSSNSHIGKQCAKGTSVESPKGPKWRWVTLDSKETEPNTSPEDSVVQTRAHSVPSERTTSIKCSLRERPAAGSCSKQ